jgi:glyoxylase-like metal-dependent hydrolase (beta-lactamase superfamily II)
VHFDKSPPAHGIRAKPWLPHNNGGRAPTRLKRIIAVTQSSIVRPNHSNTAAATELHRFQQGRFDITVLSDGYISIPSETVVSDATPPQREDILRRLAAHADLIDVATNIPLIRAGDDVVIVDIGAGTKYQPTDGRLAENLAACRVDPSSVTKVVFTHAHPDHIWATLDNDGSLRFPNATYYVGTTEWEFWMDKNYRVNMPVSLHDFARGAQRDLGAIADRVVFLRPGDDVIAGMRALDTAGHTPGHLSFELSGGDGLIITADATPNQIASLEHPEWKFGYDTLPDIAIRNRVRLVDRAATDRIKLLGYHWAYPGVGYVERHQGATRFSSA